MDSTVLYHDENSGSGQADVAFLIPTLAFSGVGADEYVYLYAKMGTTRGFETGSGYEEFVMASVVPVPEVSSVVPLALFFGGVGFHYLGRWRRKAVA